jgi:hypothetical protein
VAGVEVGRQKLMYKKVLSGDELAGAVLKDGCKVPYHPSSSSLAT